MIGKQVLLAIATACFVTLSACAPKFAGPGPAIIQPQVIPGSIIARDGRLIPLTAWTADKPRAILVAAHGINDYGNFIAMPAAWLRDQGISTYAIDQRSFGDSSRAGIWPGSRALVDDLDDSIRALRAAHPGVPLYVLGESMGGAVALVWAEEAEPGEADGLVLVAPAVWGWQALNPFYKAVLWLTARVRPSMTLTGRGLKIWPSDNIDMLRAYARDPYVLKATRVDAIYGLVTLMDEAYSAAPNVRLRTLVLYGDKDQIVPKSPVRHVVGALGEHGRFALYPKGYHMLLRDLSGPIVWKDLAAWIENGATKLPSGFEQSPVPEPVKTAGIP